MASSTTSSASRLAFRLGANPPSSPTPVERPRPFRMERSAWNVSAPARSASAKLPTPAGITMNSCTSTLESACAPPFRMFIIGTGSVRLRCGPSGVERGEVRVERLRPMAAAAALANAIDTPSRALAPSRLFVGVPSSAIICVVERALIVIAAGDRGRNLAVDVRHGLQHALAEIPAPCRRRAARALRAHRSMRRKAPPPARMRRPRA